MKKLEKALQLRKAKYIKRTGSPGNYKYIYREENIRVKKDGDFKTAVAGGEMSAREYQKIQKEKKEKRKEKVRRGSKETAAKIAAIDSITERIGLASSPTFERILKESSPADRKKVSKLINLGFDVYHIEGVVVEGGLDDGGVDDMIKNPEESKADWKE